jgi:protein TonB
MAGIFCILLLVHVLIALVIGFVQGRTVKAPVQKQEMFLAFEQVLAALPKPQVQEAPPERKVPPSADLPEISEDSTEETADALTDASEDTAAGTVEPENFSRIGDSTGSAIRMMSEAEYLVIIMKRLEENRVYPLSMRKRGMQGDMAVNFTIHPDGSLGTVELGDPKAHPYMKQAALETVKASGPFPVWEGTHQDYAMKVIIRYRLEEE